MKKYWIVAAVILVVLGIGYYFWTTKTQQTSQPVSGTAPQETGNVLSVSSNLSLGRYLVGSNGMTLYAFTKDKPNMSNCSNVCSSNWPPYTATSITFLTSGVGISGSLGTITRADGSVQLTYNHAPLYFWHGDSKPGDTTGNGYGGVWFVAKP